MIFVTPERVIAEVGDRGSDVPPDVQIQLPADLRFCAACDRVASIGDSGTCEPCPETVLDNPMYACR